MVLKNFYIGAGIKMTSFDTIVFEMLKPFFNLCSPGSWVSFWGKSNNTYRCINDAYFIYIHTL